MRKSTAIGTLVVSMLLVITAGMAWAKKTTRRAHNLQSAAIKFGPLDPNSPNGPQVAVLWGDMQKTENGWLVKLPAGFPGQMHVHSHDYRAVVIQGTIINSQLGQSADIPLQAGSFWSQPANAPHITKCAPGADCLAYVHFEGGFDFRPHAHN